MFPFYPFFSFVLCFSPWHPLFLLTPYLWRITLFLTLSSLCASSHVIVTSLTNHSAQKHILTLSLHFQFLSNSPRKGILLFFYPRKHVFNQRFLLAYYLFCSSELLPSASYRELWQFCTLSVPTGGSASW